ncbi:MAG: hypothetical protein P1U64_06410 [Alcanivoracaceae bacterium]|jgi:hypothetical protein|nr:hypothetical protein [Alcanivoracaceae bacterium]
MTDGPFTINMHVQQRYDNSNQVRIQVNVFFKTERFVEETVVGPIYLRTESGFDKELCGSRIQYDRSPAEGYTSPPYEESFVYPSWGFSCIGVIKNDTSEFKILIDADGEKYSVEGDISRTSSTRKAGFYDYFPSP